MNDEDPWSQAPFIIPVVGGPADGSSIVRPTEGRLIFGGLGPDGRQLYEYTVRQFTRRDGATVEVLALADEVVDVAFITKHGLKPVQ